MLFHQLFYAISGFLSGSILFSYHLPLWLKGINVVSQSADHNPGSANAIKLAGVPIGLLCLLADMLKGFVPVWLALRSLGPGFPLIPLVIAAPVLGHAFTPWYSFRGGKAIAVSFGALAGLLPLCLHVWVLIFWYLFFSLIIIIRPNERRSVITFICFALTCAASAFVTGRFLVALGCVLLSAGPVCKNHADLHREPLSRMHHHKCPITTTDQAGADEP